MSFRTAYGYTRSENGWLMCNRDECAIVQIPDLYLVDTAPLRKGAPLTILGAWLRWYDLHVEEIDSAVWGWSATNDVANSNHLSGTAVDVNAPRYPWGARTMPAARIAKVREGLRLFQGAVHWGADWQRADEMHYQMAWPEGDARNEEFAAKLRGGYLGIYGAAPTPPTSGGTAPVTALTPAQQHEVLAAVRALRVDVGQIRDQLGPNLWGPESSVGKTADGKEMTLRDGIAALIRYVRGER